MPASTRSLREADAELPALENHLSGRRLAHARQYLGELSLAVARYAGEADDLSGADLEVDAAERFLALVALGAQALDPQPRLARLAPPRLDLLHLASDHHVDQLVAAHFGGPARPDHPAVPKDGHAVGDGHDLGQLVRNEDERMSLGHHPSQGGEEVVDFLGREHGRGLVEDDEAGPFIEGLHYLDALLLAHRELPDVGFGIYLETVFLRELAYAPGNTPSIGEGPAPRSLAEGDVLGDGEGGNEHEVLVDHADAGSDRIRGRMEAEGKSVYDDLALVGLVHSIELAHERALACAVLAEEGVNLPRRDVEADIGIGADAREALDDVAHLNLARLVGPRSRRVPFHASRSPQFRPTVRVEP